MDLEWKAPKQTYGELTGYRVRYGRINQNELTDILITDPNVHHQVSAVTRCHYVVFYFFSSHLNLRYTSLGNFWPGKGDRI
jgi:hypothetical protein